MASQLLTAQHTRLHPDMARLSRLNLIMAPRTQLQLAMARLSRSPLAMVSLTTKPQRTRLQDDKVQWVIGQETTTKRTQIPPAMESTPILLAIEKMQILPDTAKPSSAPPAIAHLTEEPLTPRHTEDHPKDRHKVRRPTELLLTKAPLREVLLNTVRHMEGNPKRRLKELLHTETHLTHAKLPTVLLKNPAHTALRSDLPTLDTLAKKQRETTPLIHKATDPQIEARTDTIDCL